MIFLGDSKAGTPLSHLTLERKPMPGCNEENCTCPKTECERHGECAACIMHHRAIGSIVFCLRPIAEAQTAAAVEAARK